MQIAPESHAVCMALVLVLSLAGNSYYGLYYFTFDRFLSSRIFLQSFISCYFLLHLADYSSYLFS